MSYKIGQDVHYSKDGETQNGKIKEIDYGQETAFVVYHCNDDWDNYRDYTGMLTNLLYLKSGWIHED